MLLSLIVVDASDLPLKGPGEDIIKSRGVKIVATFAGKMQGLSTASLTGFADAAQVASIDPVGGEGTTFTFGVTSHRCEQGHCSFGGHGTVPHSRPHAHDHREDWS